MLWSALLLVLHFHSQMDRPPNVLVIHAGGNDLGVRTSRELARDIKYDLLRIWSMYPGIVLVWSEIVARLSWRHARSVAKLNKARRKVNTTVSAFVARNGGIVVRHRDLEVPHSGHMSRDGVHLNDVGYDIWSLALQEGVEKAVRVWADYHA
ncbi:uncharacterized protein RB166_004439 [Leptodactylus fuscus]